MFSLKELEELDFGLILIIRSKMSYLNRKNRMVYPGSDEKIYEEIKFINNLRSKILDLEADIKNETL